MAKSLYEYCVEREDTALLSQWHKEKNGELTPKDVSFGSDRRVWWRGDCGHEWEAEVCGRASAGDGCPVCTGKLVIPGVNDIVTTHPEIAKQWHPEKNGALQPTHVTRGTDKKVWWICEKKHEWEAKIYSRIHGKDCPYCSNKAVLKGFNDLATTHPEIAKQWHPEKNGDLRPEDVTSGANKKVWWICERGHVWETKIFVRASGSACPYCSNKLLLVGFNDLATTHPMLALEWHPELNGDLRPQDVMRGSGKKVWWRGVCGHEWEAKIYHRSAGTECPYCLRPKKRRKHG